MKSAIEMIVLKDLEIAEFVIKVSSYFEYLTQPFFIVCFHKILYH